MTEAEKALTSIKVGSNADFENRRSDTSESTSEKTHIEDDDRKTQLNIDNDEKQKRDIIPQLEEVEQNLTRHIEKLTEDESQYPKSEYNLVAKKLKLNISEVRKVKEEIEQGRKLKEEINVKISEDQNTCYISDICQLPDGTVILADNNNKRIKRLDVNYKVNGYLDVEDYPRGICCTGITEVAVKLSSNKVQFISVESSLSKHRDISVTGGSYYGIAYCAKAEQLWISTGRGVNVYNKDGKLLNTISQDNGQNIFKSYTQHMAVIGDSVIVTDYSDGAVCLSKKDGTVLRKLRNEGLSVTRCVCVSNDETVFIVGNTSKNIVAFYEDGNSESILNKNGCLKDKNPVSICYDKKKNCLLVGNANSNKILVLNIST